MNCKQLEQAALDAHRAALSWRRFWPTIAAEVAEAEPHDARRYHRLVRKLVGFVSAGDTDGAEPVGDGWPRPCPWELEEKEAPV